MMRARAESLSGNVSAGWSGKPGSNGDIQLGKSTFCGPESLASLEVVKWNIDRQAMTTETVRMWAASKKSERNTTKEEQ